MKLTSPTLSQRASGLLLHPTSLPGHLGSGDLGPAAFEFVDFLADAGQTWWQMLPVNPPGELPGVSPYSSTSAFAGSPFLISLDKLVDDDLLDKADTKSNGELNGDAVAQFAGGFAFRMEKLRKAFDRFETARPTATRRKLVAEFDQFCSACSFWLEDWSLYAALRDAHGGAPWYEWPRPIRLRDEAAIMEARITLERDIRFHRFVQFLFDRQWRALREYANSRGVALIGDVPIFIAHDSADVWAHRELFLLDRDGFPKTITGYPADAFTPDGQTWGHPHYRWAAHLDEKFAWWVERFRAILKNFDAVRIDHFLGFARAWHVPFGAKNGRIGEWVKAPGQELFATLRKKISTAEILAEDLGKLTPAAIKLRDACGFPGMRIFTFGFNDGANYYLPHNYEKHCVAYTGTHDNDTLVGWAETMRDTAKSRAAWKKVQSYLGTRDATQMHWPAIRAVMASVANTVIFPVQDVLGLDGDSRMNIPGTADGNWQWRLREGQLKSEHADRLCELVIATDRLPQPAAKPKKRRGRSKVKV